MGETRKLALCMGSRQKMFGQQFIWWHFFQSVFGQLPRCHSDKCRRTTGFVSSRQQRMNPSRLGPGSIHQVEFISSESLGRWKSCQIRKNVAGLGKFVFGCVRCWQLHRHGYRHRQRSVRVETTLAIPVFFIAKLGVAESRMVISGLLKP